jgi:hypothetical protein
MKRNGLRFLLIGAVVVTAVAGCASGEYQRMSKEQPTRFIFADDTIITVSQNDVVER